MGLLEALADTVPSILGIALSPIPVTAIVLVLLTPRARAASVAFGVGWLLGVDLVTAIATVASDDREVEAEASPVRAAVALAVGLLLLLVAARQVRRRDSAGTPAWTEALHTMTPVRTLLLGLVLAAANPVNIGFAVAAGVTIGSAPLSTEETIGAVIVFSVLAATTVLVPVVAYLLAPEWMAQRLAGLKDALVRHGGTVTVVVLVVLGLVLVGRGVGGLAA